MNSKPIKLKDALPAFANELESLLNRENEPHFAQQISELYIVNRCKCEDGFCATFFSSNNADPSSDRKTIELDPIDGTINIDIIDNNIVSIEVLFRDDVRNKLVEIFP